MSYFTKTDGENSPFLLRFGDFLAGEGAGITIASIDSFVRVSGDVALGAGARAPSLVETNTAIQFWLSAGTTRTTSHFEITFTTSNGATFERSVRVDVVDS